MGTLIDLLIQYLFLLLPLTIHLLHDLGEIGRNRSPNHPLMAATVLFCALAFGWWLHAWTRIHFWQFTIYSLAIHFTLFNYLLNYFRVPREPVFYLRNGFWDS